jgi:hypothetical protein
MLNRSMYESVFIKFLSLDQYKNLQKYFSNWTSIPYWKAIKDFERSEKNVATLEKTNELLKWDLHDLLSQNKALKGGDGIQGNIFHQLVLIGRPSYGFRLFIL